MMLTLKQFLEGPVLGAREVYVCGFSRMYVRKHPQLVSGKLRDPVLTLANFEVNNPGRGVFSRFISRIKRAYPRLGLYIENVINPRLRRKLVHLGFRRVSKTGSTLWSTPHRSLVDLQPPCFWMAPRGKKLRTR